MPRLDALTLKQLRALIAVSKTGSLTAAAEATSLTPPAIHSQIKNLEIALGTEMLMRSPSLSGLVPTHDGKLVVETAQQIEAILSRLGQQLRALKQGKRGQVALGVVSTGKYFAPGLIRRLNGLCPDIEISLRVGNRETVITELDRGTIDLAIMGRPPRMPEVVAVPLGSHPHSIILPPDHPLADTRNFDTDVLLRQTFIAREPGSGTRILMQRYLDGVSEGRELRLIEMDSNETIKQAVIAGLGIAMLSLHTVSEELRHGRVKLLRAPGLPVIRHWYLVYQAATVLPAPAAEIVSQVTAMNGSYFPEVLD
jgi:DNA-binding transcriptional LysR family regulator